MRYRIFNFIDMSLPAVLIVAPYAAHVAAHQLGIRLAFALPVGILSTCLLAAILEWGLWRHLRKRATPTVLLLTSLGLYTSLMAGMSLAFGHDIQSLLPPGPRMTLTLGTVVATSVQVTALASSIVLVGFVWWAQRRTRYGVQYRAQAAAHDLASVAGIPTASREMLVTVASACLLGIAGTLNALDLDLDLMSGFQPFLLGVVAAILAGCRSVPAIGLTSVALVAGLSTCGWFAGTKWEDSILLVGLVLLALLVPSPGLRRSMGGAQE